MAKSAKDVADIVNRADKPVVEPHFEPVERNAKGQFLTGHKQVSPGRPKGSRNKLAEDLIADVYAVWQEKGITCLRQLAEIDPGKFASLAVQLVPRDVQVTASVDIAHSMNMVEAFRVISNAPKVELIEHAAAEAE
jgi:hypothetical protein